MDNRPNIHELFSRASTPPVQQVQPQSFVGPKLSNNPSPNQMDPHFHHLGSLPDQQQQQQQPQQQPQTQQQQQQQQMQQQQVQQLLSSSQSSDHYSDSTSATPAMSLTDEPIVASSAPGANATNADRQNALLHLLANPTSGATRGTGAGPGVGPQLPAQVPTPPGSQRSNASPSHNETQGKILLEQLMSGNPPRSNYQDGQRGPVVAPSPPYPSQQPTEYRPYNPTDQTRDRPQPPQLVTQAAQQPPSPRKSLFEFVSPFDHLSATAGPVKKKPVPTQTAGNEEIGNWANTADPKRQSMDNLLEHLTRGQAPLSAASSQGQAIAYESYLNSSDFSTQDQIHSRPLPPPLPPKPQPQPIRTASPRASPPKTQPQPQAPRSVQAVESPPIQSIIPQAFHPQEQGGNRRDKEGSPGPRNARNRLPQNQPKLGAKAQDSPSPQAQSIIVDVSLPLDEIQAPRDSVKSTAIALVRQDPVFLPGTTIGATHWVAYAMTKGRIRVISRSSGDRTLLLLPTVFPLGSTVTDMAVFGNRLAGVTSDGGFVVWELPEVITDDIPGHVLLCVQPEPTDGLHSVKWHPKEQDTLAVASHNRVYLIDLANVLPLSAETLAQRDLHHVGQVFSISSPLMAFDFDLTHSALATISEDSTLTVWNTHDKLPYTTHKIRGEDIPSSLTFVDGGIVVGRKNGTIFQLLSVTTKNVLSTVKFVAGNYDDPDMFGHVGYDSRIQTLWVANSRRDSMIALRINLESTMVGGEEAIRGGFDQITEFSGSKPTIHFVILTANADPNGDEAHAACIAAKVPPGELALVAFSVHSSGVDQILIRKQWFDEALAQSPAKFPNYALPPQLQNKGPRQQQLPTTLLATPMTVVPPRLRTPPTDDVEGDPSRDDGRSGDKNKGKNAKNVNWKEKEDTGSVKNVKLTDTAVLGEAGLGQVLSREMRKTEENLHNRIGRLIGKEMDKQHQRLEDARAHEQAEDFARQEKILKLISTELTRNTTRVVEMAVKSEVQNSVLPSLENITKNEVKAALNDQVGRGLLDFISQSLPIEIEKLLLRPDVSSHFAHILSSNLTPLIERHVKDAVAKTFIPVYSQQASSMHQEVLRELRSEIMSVKTELTAWQGDAFRNQESSIRELEHTVRALSEQVKFLSMNTANHHHLQQAQQAQNSPGPNVPQLQSNMNQSHLRSQLPAQNQPISNYGQHTYQAPPQPPPMHQPWFSSSIAAPQASHPATLPQPPPQPQPQQERTPPIKPEQWDEVYLGILHTQDASKLRDLLGRTDPDVVLPLNGQSLVSQAVILTLIHRLSAVVGETAPNEESFKSSLWWLQRSVSLLRPDDKLITDFIPRVVPNVQHLLNTTKQRLTILPGNSVTAETARTISDVQEALRRKVMPV